MPIGRLRTYMATRRLPKEQRRLLRLHNEAARIAAIPDQTQRTHEAAKLITERSSKRTRKFLRGAGLFPYGQFDVSPGAAKKAFRTYTGNAPANGHLKSFNNELDFAHRDITSTIQRLLQDSYRPQTAESLARMPNAEKHIARRYADEPLVDDIKQNAPDVIGNIATQLTGHLELLGRRAKKGDI